MALNDAQLALLNRSIMTWIGQQQQLGNSQWGVSLVQATTAQKRAALTPILQAIKAEFTTREAGLSMARALEDAEIAAGKVNVDAVLSEL